jgi:tetratricopeptide (TPR) repeat protein
MMKMTRLRVRRAAPLVGGLIALSLIAPGLALAEKPAAPPADKAKPTAPATERARKLGPPRTAAQKARILADLYERLSAADTAENAEVLAGTIEQLWLYSGSDTTNLLMDRSAAALKTKQPELALEILDGVVSLQPDFVEALTRRAAVHFSLKNYRHAVADLQRVLAADPRHFKALHGLATIMRELEYKAPALKAYRKLLEIHPFWSDAKEAVRELEREVEGESL